MELTFQVPMQNCSLQHQILLSSPDKSTTEYHFCFGPTTLFFLGLSSCPPLFPRSILDTFQPGGLIFCCHTFWLLIQFMRFPWQVYWGGLPFPSPVDHVLSELSTMTHLSWVVLHGMAHSFIELDKAGQEQRAITNSSRKNEVAGPKQK